jgi:hypothetical protein
MIGTNHIQNQNGLAVLDRPARTALDGCRQRDYHILNCESELIEQIKIFTSRTPQGVLCVLVCCAPRGPLDRQVHNLSNTSHARFVLSFIEVSVETTFVWQGVLAGTMLCVLRVKQDIFPTSKVRS